MSRLPATGETITMKQIADFISISSSDLFLNADLGAQIGISSGGTTYLSDDFGGRDENDF